MNLKPRFLLLTALTILVNNFVYAQKNFWSPSTGNVVPATVQSKFSGAYKVYQLDTTAFFNFLSTAPKELTKGAATPLLVELPMPGGDFAVFKVVETSMMEPGLAEQLKHIKTFSGTGLKENARVQLDFTPLGFHAMVSGVNGTVIINPVSPTDRSNYTVYYKKDFKHTEPYFEEGEIKKIYKPLKGVAARTDAGTCVGPVLRTYRLAVACTGEYAHAAVGTANPTAEQTMAAIVTTVNRVNGIYQSELGIKMVLVSNNLKIVFTNNSTDPFAGNRNASKLIDESQFVIDSLIGTANYDVGHTFSTGAGGLAYQGVVCDKDYKASGVTGQSAPVGDAYDVDFVAHEIGHQFGASHTFNATSGSCSGNGSSATNVEPGSGSTIMAYAGICNSTNDLQAHSDPQFHAVSLDEILDYVTSADGAMCGVTSATGNHAPAVNAGSDYTIPKSTPFVLSGSATDSDGDALVYSWEQIDAGGPFNDWNKVSGNDPLFRSFAPMAVPVRYFPKIADVIGNKTTIGEILPAYGRNIHFRLTARDNKPNGGGVCSDDALVAVSNNAGPFVVTAPNTAVTWQAGNFETVTWNVANTTAAPVNCGNVAIELSVDGGYTYPYTIISSTPNDGSEEIVVPNYLTNKARLRISAVGNIFYDISNADFSIIASATKGFVLNNPQPVISCSNDVISTLIKTSAIEGYTGSISLSASGNPAGSTVAFGTNPVVAGGSSTVTLNGTVPPGNYQITIMATSGSYQQSRTINILIGTPTNQPATSTPTNNATGVFLTPTFTWTEVNSAESYNLQISTASSFATIVQNISGLKTNSYTVVSALAENTMYYWRVRSANACGNGPFSPSAVFKTVSSLCGDTLVSTDVPKHIPDTIATINSTLQVLNGGTIADVNVIGVNGTHQYVGDLIISLLSPANTEVILFNRSCNNTTRKNFNIGFDDEASSATIPCPPTTGDSRKPYQALSAFDYQNSAGTWTLRIQDVAEEDSGSLKSWGLRICTYYATSLPVHTLTFSGEKNNNNSVSLKWLTGYEINNDRFVIERSADGTNFSPIGTVDAGSQPGTLQQYFFNDGQPVTGINYYRLKQIDIDGSFRYSAVVKILIDKTGKVYLVFPNPATDKSTVRFLTEMNNVTVRLHNATGQVLYQQKLASVHNGQQVELPVKKLGKGLYSISILTADKLFTEKVLVQ